MAGTSFVPVAAVKGDGRGVEAERNPPVGQRRQPWAPAGSHEEQNQHREPPDEFEVALPKAERRGPVKAAAVRVRGHADAGPEEGIGTIGDQGTGCAQGEQSARGSVDICPGLASRHPAPGRLADPGQHETFNLRIFEGMSIRWRDRLHAHGTGSWRTMATSPQRLGWGEVFAIGNPDPGSPRHSTGLRSQGRHAGCALARRRPTSMP